MEVVHPVVLAAHIVVGAGQQQKLCIRPVKSFLHSAEAALKDGALNMAEAVHCADKEHAVVQFGQRLNQKGIKLPAGQPVKFALELPPSFRPSALPASDVPSCDPPPWVRIRILFLFYAVRCKNASRRRTLPSGGGS